MKIHIVIQSRLRSSRLPGKALLPILGQSMIKRIYDRCASTGLPTVVATTDRPEDALICREVPQFFRGNEDNVLKRMVDCAEATGADAIVRITGDCPMVSPGLIKHMVQNFENDSLDYLSNINPPSFPDGYDVEIVRVSSLAQSQKYAKSHELEHVTLAIRNNMRNVRHHNVELINDIVPWMKRHLPEDLSTIRMSVDTFDDYLNLLEVCERFADKLYGGVHDVLSYLAHTPGLLKRMVGKRSDAIPRSDV